MKLLITLFILCVALGVDAYVYAQELKLPYKDEGACPFECCQYRQWTVEKATKLRDAPSRTASFIATVEERSDVTGVTGVVITYQTGQVKILNPIKATLYVEPEDYSKPREERLFEAGEVLNSLHYVGEGACLYWYQGKKVLLEIYCLKEGMSPSPQDFKVLSEPESSWWVKIRTKKGQVGWSDESDNFGNQDACG